MGTKELQLEDQITDICFSVNYIQRLSSLFLSCWALLVYCFWAATLLFLQHQLKGARWWCGGSDPLGDPRPFAKQPDVVITDYFIVLLVLVSDWHMNSSQVKKPSASLPVSAGYMFAPCLSFSIQSSQQKFPTLLSLLLHISHSFLGSISFCSVIRSFCCMCFLFSTSLSFL